MIFNPLFVTENSNGQFSTTKQNKLAGNKYLFSDIVKVVMNPGKDPETSISANTKTLVEDNVRLSTKGDQKPVQLKLKFLSDADTEQAKLNLAEILPAEIAELLIDNESISSDQHAISYLSKEPLKGELKQFVNSIIGADLIAQNISDKSGLLLSLEDKKSAVNLELIQDHSNKTKNGKITVQTLVVPQKSKLLSLVKQGDINSLIRLNSANELTDSGKNNLLSSAGLLNNETNKPTLSVYTFNYGNDEFSSLTKSIKANATIKQNLNLMHNLKSTDVDSQVGKVPLDKISFIPSELKNINTHNTLEKITDSTLKIVANNSGAPAKDFSVSKITIVKKQSDGINLKGLVPNESLKNSRVKGELTRIDFNKQLDVKDDKLHLIQNNSNKAGDVSETKILSAKLSVLTENKSSLQPDMNGTNKNLLGKLTDSKENSLDSNPKLNFKTESAHMTQNIKSETVGKTTNNESDQKITSLKNIVSNLVGIQNSSTSQSELEINEENSKKIDFKNVPTIDKTNTLENIISSSKNSTQKTIENNQMQNLNIKSVTPSKENNTIIDEQAIKSPKIVVEKNETNSSTVDSKIENIKKENIAEKTVQYKSEDSLLNSKSKANQSESNQKVTTSKPIVTNINESQKNESTKSGIEKNEMNYSPKNPPLENASSKVSNDAKIIREENSIVQKTDLEKNIKSNVQVDKNINKADNLTNLENDKKQFHGQIPSEKIVSTNKNETKNETEQKVQENNNYSKPANEQVIAADLNTTENSKENKKVSVKIKNGVKSVSKGGESDSRNLEVNQSKDNSFNRNAEQNEQNLTNPFKNSVNINNLFETKNHENYFQQALNKEDLSINNLTGKVNEVNQDQNRHVVRSVEVIKEISKFISKQEKGSLSFDINPEKLGKMKITLDTADHVMRARIEVENEQSKQLIERNLDKLHQELKESGVQLSSLNISLGYSKQQKENNAEGAGNKRNELFENNDQVGEVEEENHKKSMGYNTYEYLA